jgi:predicted porin
MKKTLAAVAVLGAFAGSAFAADVTLYGRIDGGFQYNDNQVKIDGQKVVEDSSFKMGSGQSTGSRFGIKGTEEISEGLKVGFVLEHGFNFDDGSFGDDDRMWNREASLQLISDTYGTLALGRMGTIKSDCGTFALFADRTNPFGTSWSNIPGVGSDFFAGTESRWDNMITYKSPTFAGTTVYAQYSMGGNGDDEMTHRADRYAALGVDFVAGNLELVGVVDWIDEAYGATVVGEQGDTDIVDTKDRKDQYTINLGGSYDFGVMKTYLSAQYFKNANDVAGIVSVMDDAIELDDYVVEGDGATKLEALKDPTWGAYFDEFKGYGIAIGANVPAFGGNFVASLGYTDAEEENVDADVTVYSATLGYTYPLSKRTNLYAVGGYNNREFKFNGNDPDYNKVEQDQYQVIFGMVHKF